MPGVGVPVSTPSGLTEPLTLAEAKRYLGLSPDDTTENDDIQSMITSAREWAELLLWRTIVRRSRTVYFPDFPADCGELYLPYGPVNSITTLKYMDGDEDYQTVDAADYRLYPDLEHVPASLRTNPGGSWPVENKIMFYVPTAVEVVMDCGDTTPAKLIVDGIKILLKSLYGQRDLMMCDMDVRPIPQAFCAITGAYNLKHDRLFMQYQVD